MEGKILSVKQYRMMNDRTQKEMADILGITQSSYSLKEIGKTNWQVKDLVVIGEYFGIDLNLLKELQPVK